MILKRRKHDYLSLGRKDGDMRFLVLFLMCHFPPMLWAAQCNDLHWATEAAKKPVYNNQIFSKAITYEVEWPGTSRLTSKEKADFEDGLGLALQSALTEWGATLLLIRSQLPPTLRSYLENSLFCTPGSCQYNAPPAVRVSCKENASLVFLIYAPGGAAFPNAEDGAVARAQVAGRTILLNMRSYRFIYDQHLFAILNDRSWINLTAVVAHELGHSFGLSHATPSEKSIMLANLTGMTQPRYPTSRDGKQFAEILAQFVSGRNAGEFSSLECQGLKVAKR
jgi:Matrixin